ncbi:MAG TPA: NrsF family protein [Hyphomicrobiaceae bacterium]|nr:NrsF family protein [Hyphomicrobiaceae bacterium]
MSIDTDELIKRLSADVRPVSRLAPPWRRAALWLALSLPYVAAVVWGKVAIVDAAHVLADVRFLIEQTATFATAATGAVAAFASTVPGFDRRLLLLPLAPLAVWLASVGAGCIDDWLRLGPEGLAIRPDWECLPAASVIGIAPAAIMVLMLRRGAPLYPRTSLLLGALAVAAIANFGMQIFHFRDASIMVLIWHVGSVAVIAPLAGLAGERLIGWRPLGVSK